ncbi:MAG: hypothetical protein R3321_14485 [Nitrososphaeraceae archaeon]|nr:hypothetical protein [Nitrososphaeraceae archaeon]
MEVFFSFSRKPPKYRKIRQIASKGNMPIFGVTIPQEIQKQFADVHLTLQVSGNAIIMASGCPHHG